jgi:hypothetical protein
VYLTQQPSSSGNIGYLLWLLGPLIECVHIKSQQTCEAGIIICICPMEKNEVQSGKVSYTRSLKWWNGGPNLPNSEASPDCAHFNR